MSTTPLCTRTLILAAYLLAAILPLLALAEASPPSTGEHAQRMVAAGHLAHLPPGDGPAEEAQLLLCQQHCLFAAAALPPAAAGQAAVAQALGVAPDVAPKFASLAIPPPAPPPKGALV